MQLVQVTLTDELAGLLAASAGITLAAHEADEIVTLSEDEVTEYQRLAAFLTEVASNPSHFPVRESMVRGLKTKLRAAKGPAQPQSRKKKRTQGQQKRDRVARREAVAQHNAARDAYEKDRIDLEAHVEERRKQIETEPKFNITDIAGNVILEGVPQSMVVAIETSGGTFADDQPRIILPNNVEREGS